MALPEGAEYAFGSGKERVIFWKSVARSLAAEDGPQLDQERAAALAALVFDTLPAYTHAGERGAVDAAVDAGAARHPALLRELTVSLLKAAAARPPAFPAGRLLGWAASLLAALPAGSGKKAAAKLIEALGALHESVAAAADDADRPALRQAAAAKLRRMLRRAPALAEEFSEAAAAPAAAAAPGGGAGVVGALLDATSGGGADAAAAAAEARELGLKLLCEGLLPSKDRPPPAAVACLAPLLSTLTPAEWAGRVAPALSRALRRTPDSALATAAHALRRARGLDLGDAAASDATAEVVSLTLQQLRTKEAVRPAALEALAAVAALVASPAALARLVGAVRGLLDGSTEGKIKAASERLALVNALTALAPPPPPPPRRGAPAAGAGAAEGDAAAGAAAADAAAFCAAFLREEPTEEVKAALAACLAAWLPHASPPPAAAGPAFAALLGDAKEPPRRAALRALTALASSSPAALRAFASDLAAPLGKLVKEGASKAAARGEGLAALAAAAVAGGPAAAAALAVPGAIGPDAPLLAGPTIGKLPPAEAAAAGPLAAELLLRHGGALASAGARAAAARLLAAALLHHAREVRSAAAAAAAPVAEAASADGALAAELADALRHWENDPDAAGVLGADGGAPEEGRAEGTHSWRFAGALAALAPRPAAGEGRDGQAARVGPRALAALLLAAHHPAITRGVKDKRRGWQAALRHAPGLERELQQGATISEVTALLFGPPDGLSSPRPGDVEAASHALGSCLAAAGVAAHEAALPGLQALLDRAEHDALTKHDVEVWRTPEGVLSSEVVPEGVYQGEVVANKNVRKARGRMRMDNRAFATGDDDSDDEPPPPPTRAPAPAPSGRGASRGGAAGGRGGRGGAAAAGDARQREFRERKLAEEAEVRARVVAIKAKLEKGLRALAAIADAAPSAAAGHLRDLSPLVLPLLASPVAGGAALDAARALARCMPPPLGGRSLTLAGCLRLVVLAERGAEGVDYASIPDRAAVAEVITALARSTVAQRSPLSGPAYALVFPVLRAVLHCPHHTPLHDEALEVLSLHVRPDQDVPRAESLELLYHTLGIIPAYRQGPGAPGGGTFHLPATLFQTRLDRLQPLLRSLCSGALEPELPAAAAGLLAAAPHVRAAALLALPSVPSLGEGLPPEGDPLAVLHIARFDPSEANAEAARALWDDSGCALPEGGAAWFVESVAARLASPHADVRAAAAAALAAALEAAPARVGDAMAAVVALYASGEDEAQKAAAAKAAAAAAAAPAGGAGGKGGKKGGFGLDDEEKKLQVLSLDSDDDDDPLGGGGGAAEAARRLSARLGSAAALKAVAPVLGPKEVSQSMEFLISSGLADPDPSVREAMVAAGVAVVDLKGADLAGSLMPLFGRYLEKRAGARDEGRYDLLREGVVVLMGTLAAHLQQGDAERAAIVETLLDVLDTPSEAVQRAASGRLAPLMAGVAEDRARCEAIIARLLATLQGGAAYGARRGAAFGLAGVVKGLGIASLKSYGVLESLKAFVEDKKSANAREGGLMAFECLCERLGRLFEPYVIHTLPLLLSAFGDAAPAVRDAAADAARAIMGQLSASGVKLVLPALLKGLEDPTWRTKQGSTQLLGAMAHCAPKQLGSCLPTIVPRLGGVLSDPHPKVQGAAREALCEVGRVIGSPEMAALVPSLLAAIADPNAATKDCLDTLLATTFINTIDAPSLALVVPVVHRGLRDRTGETKRKAARIVGSMCSLVNDPKDMVPYVSLLMPELQKSLVDPLPEVRATAARAMGQLLRGMGPGVFADLLPWLLATLRSEGSSVERSGAAQGLAEALAVLGEGHLSELLPEMLASARARNAFVREGHLTLFRYLPLTMEAAFQRHLGEVLPAILDGLSDEAEGVRDAALAAARAFVEIYARSCLPLLLPAVEAGLGHEAWRIRQASVELCGELLFKVAGTSGKVKLDGGSDDEGAASEAHGQAILAALGRQRRDEVLSKLYVTRSDVQYAVRNGALHNWKTLVVNTPRMLQEILPALMAEVINALADQSEDRRTAAARCLGELVRKMGERVLHRMLPILRDSMASDSASTRQGVCAGLREVLEAATRHQLGEHLPDILPPIQAALCDADPSVREAAGAAFGVLFRGGAHSAVDGVVPSLLAGLDSDAHYSASVEGLRVILGVRPTTFNGVAPKLLRAPVTGAALRALGELAGVAGPALPSHLPAILSTCLNIASTRDDHRAAAAEEAALRVAQAAGEEGLPALVDELLRALEDASGRARGAAGLVAGYCRAAGGERREALQDHADALMTALISLFAEEDEALVLAAWGGLDAVAAAIPKEDAPAHVVAAKDAVLGAKEKERRKRRGGALRLAGLCLPPKALGPLVPLYLQGALAGGTPEVREAAVEALGELVDLTSEEALKPFVVQITGPLIRIVGDRFPSQIKAAILVTLGGLIGKAGAGLKPFVPQLQTTFLKCLPDPAAPVRAAAAANLGELTRLSARVDQLTSDLAASAVSAPEADARVAYLQALRGALAASGPRLAPATLSKVEDALEAAARAAGALPAG
ncbi:hypothetical protein Rsub_02372, partial [Raphidocelis subcapitata]